MLILHQLHLFSSLFFIVIFLSFLINHYLSAIFLSLYSKSSSSPFNFLFLFLTHLFLFPYSSPCIIINIIVTIIIIINVLNSVTNGTYLSSGSEPFLCRLKKIHIGMLKTHNFDIIWRGGVLWNALENVLIRNITMSWIRLRNGAWGLEVTNLIRHKWQHMLRQK